jgi:hypothetical protein
LKLNDELTEISFRCAWLCAFLLDLGATFNSLVQTIGGALQGVDQINVASVFCIMIVSFFVALFGSIAVVEQSRVMALLHFIFAAIYFGVVLGFTIYGLVVAGDILPAFVIGAAMFQLLVVFSGFVAGGFHYTVVAKVAEGRGSSGVALLSDVDTRI